METKTTDKTDTAEGDRRFSRFQHADYQEVRFILQRIYQT